MRQQRHLKVLPGGAEENLEARAIKVAFATTDLKHVDQHFGSAEKLAVYAVTLEETSMSEVAQFGHLAQDGNEDKLAAKMDALEGCIAVYCQAVGSSAIAQMRAKGIQPVKVDPGTPIPLLLQGLQTELKEGPEGWIARALSEQTKDPSRFDAMEEEGWDE